MASKTIRVDDEVFLLIVQKQDEELRAGRLISKSEAVKLLLKEADNG